jgi:hypothetical protein
MNVNNFYLESGRIPDINLIQPKTIYSIYDACQHSGISYNQVAENNLNEYNNLVNNQIVSSYIEPYTIGLYGNLVNAIFYPSQMFLQIKFQDYYLNIKLLNNGGISVNSILNYFQLNHEFPNAERGRGNDQQTFVAETNVKDRNYLIFLSTCMKTVCDKIVSTELTPKPYIGNISTTDGYIWAGVTYKYLLGEYPILPTIYESVKNGWNVKPGIYDVSQQISDRIVRLLHLYSIFNMNEELKYLIEYKFKGFQINKLIIESYYNLIFNYYKIILTSQKILNETTTIDNVFNFLSAIKIINEFNIINKTITELKNNLDNYVRNPDNIELLLKIPLFEDVLKLKTAEEAMNNQQTIVYETDIIYEINLYLVLTMDGI